MADCCPSRTAEFGPYLPVIVTTRVGQIRPNASQNACKLVIKWSENPQICWPCVISAMNMVINRVDPTGAT